MSEFQARIRAIAFGGAGVGEVIDSPDLSPAQLGITSFVPFTIPGEIVRATVQQAKERYIEGELLQILDASEDRATPSCRHFTQCGGCELQHIAYDAQLKEKLEMVRGALRAGRLSSKTIDALKSITPSTPYRYRRRLHLHVSSSGDVGLYRNRSRSVVVLDECPISLPIIEETIRNLRSIGRQLAGKITSIEIDADDTGVILLFNSPYDLNRTEALALEKTIQQVATDFQITSAGKSVISRGREFLELPLPGSSRIKLTLPAGSFSQVNWQINHLLISRVLELVSPARDERILDLYAGAGNFTLPLAIAGGRVIAVENNPRLVAGGRQAAERSNLKIEYVESSVERFIEKQRQAKARFDYVVADPPRSGLGRLVSELNLSQRLILISCHLPSFVRDVKAFEDQGWKVETIEPFDMFAQTSYLEIVAALTKIS